ncbi:phosphoglycolate phosphatase [Sinobacterium caligoides]|nr:phosphoglycolate phosphatase [Sinobacterium caligoides]
MQTLPKAVLFDLDGTLVDSVPDLAMAVDAMLQQLGFAAAGEDKVRLWVGKGAYVLVHRALADARDAEEYEVVEGEVKAALALFETAYSRYLNAASVLYPGVAEFLPWLQARKVPLAIVTNKPIAFVPALLKSFKIEQYFSVVLGGDSVANGKPHPQMLLEACRQLGVAATDSLMIGDSCNDIKAARAAMMPVVGLTYGYNHGRPIAQDNPDRVADNLLELVADWS